MKPRSLNPLAKSSRGRPRVAQLIPLNGIGGVETAARSIAERQDLPIDFHLFTLAANTPDSHPRVSAGSARWLANPAAHLAALRRLLRFSPDVLICSLWPCAPVAMLFKMLRPSARLVCFLHAERPAHSVDRLVHSLLIPLADEVWADSAATLQSRLGRDASGGRVISFLVDRLHPASANRQPGAGFVTWCRIAHQKGLDRALLLIRALRDRGMDASFDIWGPDGGEKANLEAQAKLLAISAHVNFRGPLARGDFQDVAASNAFFLLPSRFEGMGMSVVEAMQLGLAPIVTPVGEIASYCQDGRNALIIDAGRLNDAANAIIQLASDPIRYRELCLNAAASWTGATLHADDVALAATALAERRKSWRRRMRSDRAA